MVRLIAPLISAALLARLALAIPLPTNHEEDSLERPPRPYWEEDSYAPEHRPEASRPEWEEDRKEWEEPNEYKEEPKEWDDRKEYEEPPRKEDEYKEPPRKEDEYEDEYKHEPTPAEEHKRPEETRHVEEPKYGSGYDDWSDEYDNCVRQCMQTYAPPSEWKMPTPTTPDDAERTGGVTGDNGVTHTVIVAPTQGVLRFIPLATNASVGDTVEFRWGASPHTVTKGSAIEVCNATSDNFFTSGRQEEGFVYREVVNDTNPVYYYCGVADHCQRGMFGMINPPSSGTSPSSFGAEVVSWAAKNPTIKEAWSYTQNLVKGSPAENWGNALDVSGITDDTLKEEYAINVMYTRLFIAQNPESFKDGQFVPVANATIPTDIREFLTAQAGSPDAVNSPPPRGTPTGPSPNVPEPTAPSSTDNGNANGNGNGAASVKTSSVAVALSVAAAAFFLI